MNSIKYISRLSPYYEQDTLAKLLISAENNSVEHNLMFKVADVQHISGTKGRKIYMQSEQIKVREGNILTKDEIKTITRGMFPRVLFPNVIIEVDCIVFTGFKITQVDADWLAAKLKRNQVTIKDMSDDMGIDKSNLSAWVTGLRPMSQPVKALMYYYFRNIDQERNEFSDLEIKEIRKLVKNLEISELTMKKTIRRKLRTEFGFFISEFKEHGEPFGSADLEKLLDQGMVKIKSIM